jgi:STE24 endopeptidase
MGAHRYRLPLAIAVAVVATAAATLILRPRSGLIDPAAVDATDYFSARELDRAEDYRGPQRLIGLGSLLVSGATVAFIALRPPRRARRALERAGRRPLLGSAAAGASLALALVVVTLPFAAAAHERAVDVGLSTQDWGPWFGDLAKAAGLEAVFAGGGAAVLILLVRRFPRRWWAGAAVAVVAISAGFLFISPILLEPIFNKFEKLPPGQLRSDVLELAERSDVDVGEVYRVDASRRTTGANAYVGGLGSTKRVVLYDNLIEDFPPEQVRSVVAHELGHVKHDDLLRGLLFIAIVAPAGMLVVKLGAERLAGGEDLGTPAALPALLLAFALVSFAGQVAGNALSRPVEARADAYSLELTHDPAAHIALERRLALRNVSDPEPPRFLHLLFGTHPTTVDRIGYGLTFAREEK